MASTFWTSPDLQPKRKYRFLIEFGLLTGKVLDSYFCRSVTKPSYSIGIQEHALLDYNFRFPGRVSWDPISATFVDTVQENAANRLYELLLSFGYVDPSETTDKLSKTISKKAVSENIGSVITLKELHANGTTVGTWVLNNPIISRATFGDLSYADDTLVDCTVDITYDWARYERSVLGV